MKVQDHPWIAEDYAQFFLGILDGAMGAFPDGTEPYYCSKNSTAARVAIDAAVLNFNQGEVKDGMQKL